MFLCSHREDVVILDDLRYQSQEILSPEGIEPLKTDPWARPPNIVIQGPPEFKYATSIKQQDFFLGI